MRKNKLTFVSFEPSNGQYISSISLEGLFSLEDDPELILRKASEEYKKSIIVMRNIVNEIEMLRKKRVKLPARKVWELGNSIFELINNLEKLSLQINGLYQHLIRDLGVKRKWLEKVLIFRRYLPNVDIIPESLNWGRCEKGTRRIAESLKR
ncbi:MAG: hypothetical protein NUV70_08355 [Caldiserica bacterium]|jgi:hypothetical protein|nr:hypothetical protein [Caldisericota bacterium]